MGQRLLVLATPLALLANGWVIFYVLKEPPTLDVCADARAPGVDAYREGLGTYATAAAVVIGALVARTSQTAQTRYALAGCAWLTVLYNAENDAFWPHALIATVVAVPGVVLVVCSALATLAMRRPRPAQLTYLWTALLVFVPAATGLVASEGVPGLCLS